MVSLHVPLNDSTRHMIDAEALGRMKPKSILIDTCRGEVVDEVALTAVLRNGKILVPPVTSAWRRSSSRSSLIG